MVNISAILLGAGKSKRMGVDKLLLPWGRKTVLKHCFDTLFRSEVQEVVVILGIQNKGIRNLFQGWKTKVITNPHSDKGMSTSIKKGIQSIHPSSNGILIALGDQPFLKTRTVNALIRTFGQGKDGIIIPSFRGRRGHPVIFDRRYERELLNLKGDVGGRSIIERYPEDVRVIPVKSIGVVKDIDTCQDYKERFKNEECSNKRDKGKKVR